jgi:glycerophosphoryl diester phosphodiesterase
MQTAKNEPLTIAVLARSVWRDFLRARYGLYVYEILFELLKAWLLVPAIAVVLSIVLSRAGHVAVSNQDILAFLLTPLGLLYAALFGTVGVALLLLEQGGIMVLVALMTGPAERPSVRQTLRVAFPQTWRIAQLGAVQAGLLALALVPFVLLAVLTYALFLSEHDIYFYWKDRPPAFWLAAGICGVLLLGALTVAAWLSVRWAFALPILLFENQSSRAALRGSRQRVRGAGWRIGFVLFGWLAGVLLLGVVLEAGFRFLAAAVLDSAGERPTTRILLLLVAHGGLLATLSFVLVVGLGLVTRRLYLLRSEQLGLGPREGGETVPGGEKPMSPWAGRLVWLSLPLFLLAPLAVWTNLSRLLADRPPVQITAHRGHSLAAPENTLRAVDKAIESGADYAEVDVQRTADGFVVLLHDSDLKRVAGLARGVEELPYEEVRKLDVGSWFGPEFAGVYVPTLAEVIDRARGRIKLNIEMKFFGPDRELARDVARLIREKEFENDCIVTSFNYDALQEAKRINADLRTGLIVAFALGDLNRLEIDLLSVRADWLSDELLRGAHRRGKEVHVWTVNDAGQMARLIKRGVDNIITDDPDLGIRVRDEWTDLTGTERLVLSSRLLLGLDP